MAPVPPASALDPGKQSASSPGRFITFERSSTSSVQEAGPPP